MSEHAEHSSFIKTPQQLSLKEPAAPKAPAAKGK